MTDLRFPSGEGGGMKRFEIERILSRGGMAEILLAREKTAVGERHVVIKRVRSKYACDPEFRAMFMDEARIAVLLEHPNVVRAYDVVVNDDCLSLILEYLRGDNLRVLMSGGRALPHDHAIAIGMSTAAGLHYVHSAADAHGRPLGIVHRDLSPNNVFVCHDGSIKVLDFGVALSNDRQSRATQKGILKGKFAYMSPEQSQGEDVDARSDIFSLGVLLYEVTTGRKLFRGTRPLDIVQQVIEAPVEPPTRVCPGYPVALERVILQALSKDRAERQNTALEVEEALAQVADGLGHVLAPRRLRQFVTSVLGEKDPSVPSEPCLEDSTVPSRPSFTPHAEAAAEADGGGPS